MVVEQPAAGQMVLEDAVGGFVIDATIDHPRHPLAGDLDERIRKGIAQAAHAAHLGREPEGAHPFFKNVADGVGAGGNPARVHAHPHPVRARVGKDFGIFLQIGVGKLAHDLALGWAVRAMMRGTSVAFSRP